MGKVVYTKITPLPSNIPRQLAIDLLHSHEELVRLNPLVTDVKGISAPRNAENDEFFANWYEITENIPFGLGIKKRFVFKQCWHDQAWGVQNHTMMPKFLEMRNLYRIGGNQPGEPREPRELGVNKPDDGLYLREDINIDVFVPLAKSFVEKEMQSASATMIGRMKRKAELLDEGRLLAMFENGMLKTTNASTAATFDTRASQSSGQGSRSRNSSNAQRTETFDTPGVGSPGIGTYRDVNRNSSIRSSVISSLIWATTTMSIVTLALAQLVSIKPTFPLISSKITKDHPSRNHRAVISKALSMNYPARLCTHLSSFNRANKSLSKLS